MTRNRAAVELLEDWRWLRDHGVLPGAGGKLDQSPRFIEAVDVIEGELAKLKARTQKDGT